MADRFQSTLPLRGATRHVRNQQAHRAISIHTPLAGSDSCAAEVSARSEISIHTPLAGSDFTSMRLLGNRKNDFNPHSPCGERLRFSTKTIGRNYFNPHSPCGERPGDCAEQFIELVISIHTPLAGSDIFGRRWTRPASTFQSTLPLRGATNLPPYIDERYLISIHTPLAGSDRRNETFLTK